MWVNASTAVQYTDGHCQGPSCNPSCPDGLTIGILTGNNWAIWTKIVITFLILVLVATCVLVKVLIVFWMYWLEAKQAGLMKNLEDHERTYVTVRIT